MSAGLYETPNPFATISAEGEQGGETKQRSAWGAPAQRRDLHLPPCLPVSGLTAGRVRQVCRRHDVLS